MRKQKKYEREEKQSRYRRKIEKKKDREGERKERKGGYRKGQNRQKI